MRDYIVNENISVAMNFYLMNLINENSSNFSIPFTKNGVNVSIICI